VRLVTNPLVLRMLLVAVSAGSLFVFGLILMRKMRKDLAQDGNFTSGQTPSGAPEFLAYQAVITDLKREQKALLDQLQAERLKTQMQGRLQAAALENLPCGVLLLSSQLLVQQANPAAKELLGFGSPTGMRTNQIFEGWRIMAEEGAPNLSETIAGAMRENTPKRGLRMVYTTPAGETRNLAVDVVPVAGTTRETRGVVCVLSGDVPASQANAPAMAVAQAASTAGAV
jgi:PAS domain-containing protein